ncbi:DUF983 domain-containing protein [Novosphingobium jiangmenense]|uniref:DUF983 domain-containing protein n=1 Tax=Novosphingobium jiangmenense TaxID=2791981 RepID=A0ABS0HE13_9SPHN|nr:DUF983 domain-containing protein [Novosphingobium jiangmenense]MBF9150520.1 DUF983 domain-containing protein [Novosphingobium jiangmenense]
MPSGDSQHSKGQPGITQAALFGLCPRCGAKGLWAGLAALADRCPTCGLEFERLEPRGRGMYLVVLPVTILLVLAALKLDDIVQLPVWALIGLWGTLVPAVVTATLRYAKATVLMARLEKEGLQ